MNLILKVRHNLIELPVILQIQLPELQIYFLFKSFYICLVYGIEYICECVEFPLFAVLKKLKVNNFHICHKK